ncbi:MAG TPA: TIGR03435 family protein, partial [Vicinamibacterales bacterium]|nr:TIGR03435 family protein [Vicinamibacterales bacterium]
SKRNTSGTLNSGMRNQPGGRVTVINMTLRQLVRSMNRLQDYQVVNNAGDWLSTDRWDIDAKAANDAPLEQLVLMLRSLVAERFSLVTHRERRDGPSLFTALQEQLGLKLESYRAPSDVLVIDSAKRPAED